MCEFVFVVNNLSPISHSFGDIVTQTLEIGVFRRFYPAQSRLKLCEGCSHGTYGMKERLKRLEPLGDAVVKPRDPMIIFDTLPACDRRTNGHVSCS